MEIRPATPDVSAVSSLTGPSREFTRDSSSADLRPCQSSREFTRDSSGRDVGSLGGGRDSGLSWLNCADESRLKPRLGPTAEAASRGQVTDRPSREFTRDSSGADLRPCQPSRESTRDSSGADLRPCQPSREFTRRLPLPAPRSLHITTPASPRPPPARTSPHAPDSCRASTAARPAPPGSPAAKP